MSFLHSLNGLIKGYGDYWKHGHINMNKPKEEKEVFSPLEIVINDVETGGRTQLKDNLERFKREFPIEYEDYIKKHPNIFSRIATNQQIYKETQEQVAKENAIARAKYPNPTLIMTREQYSALWPQHERQLKGTIELNSRGSYEYRGPLPKDISQWPELNNKF